MASTTVRVDTETHTRLRELACEMHAPMQSVLAQAVETFYRTWLLDSLNDYYDALRADPKRWAEELEGRRLWDATLTDGLRDDPYPLDPDQVAEADAALAKRGEACIESTGP